MRRSSAFRGVCALALLAGCSSSSSPDTPDSGGASSKSGSTGSGSTSGAGSSGGSGLSGSSGSSSSSGDGPGGTSGAGSDGGGGSTGGADASAGGDGGNGSASDGGADGGTSYGPPELGLTSLDLSFEDTFTTLSRAPDMSKRWQSQYWFGGSGARADLSDTVYLDESVKLSDGTTKNPFVGSKPGLLDIVAGSLGSVTAPSPWQDKKYYAGSLTTLPSFHQDWGYYEVVLKMPPSPGAWGAFFLYPFTDYPDPSGTTAEMDFFESTGYQPTYINTTMHDYATHLADKKSYTDMKIDFTAAFTTIGFDFEPTGVTRYIDNVKKDAEPLPVFADFTGKSWYLVFSHDVDLSPSPYWYMNTPDPATYPKHLQVQSVRVFKTAKTTVIGGSAALIKL